MCFSTHCQNETKHCVGIKAEECNEGDLVLVEQIETFLSNRSKVFEGITF
jgi:hypothetical protein